MRYSSLHSCSAECEIRTIRVVITKAGVIESESKGMRPPSFSERANDVWQLNSHVLRVPRLVGDACGRWCFQAFPGRFRHLDL